MCLDPDLPSNQAWIYYVKKHPEFAEKLRDLYHSMPYSFQARARSLSPGFRIECERLRVGGMTKKNIVKTLGVSWPSVTRALRGFDEKMGIAQPRNWDREDFEAILDRIREQRRSLEDVCGDPDLPEKYAWKKYVKKHPEFAEKLREIYHSLPYSFQAKAKNFSPNFRIDCERLRTEGMTKEDIAKKLGVSRPPVTRVLRGFDERLASRKSRKIN